MLLISEKQKKKKIKANIGPMTDEAGDLTYEGMWMENSTAMGEMLNYTFVETEDDDLPQWKIVMEKVNIIVVNVLMILMVFGMGAATNVNEIWHQLKRPWGCLIGIVCQFGILPVVGFGLCISLTLAPTEALGVLILICCPGGSLSNFFTYWVDGDLALSIIMTLLSSVTAFIGMPLNLWLYTSRWTTNELYIPYKNILISLTLVAVPTFAGIGLRHYSVKLGDITKKVCSIAGWLCTIAAATMLIITHWKTFLNSQPNYVVAPALASTCGVITTYIIAKIACFSHKVSRTIAIETGLQNIIIAINIINMSYPDPQVRSQMVTFPTMYGLMVMGESFICIALYQAWKCMQNRNNDEQPPIPNKDDNNDKLKENPSCPNTKHYPILISITSIAIPD